jgi:group I intron endonuclease
MTRRIKLVGIYCITCIPTNKKYIGSSIDMMIRWNSHLISLLINKHSNKKLQADFNKYGLINFSFNVLVMAERNITKQRLLILEQLEIDSVHRMNLYNNKRAIAKLK